MRTLEKSKKPNSSFVWLGNLSRGIVAITFFSGLLLLIFCLLVDLEGVVEEFFGGILKRITEN